MPIATVLFVDDETDFVESMVQRLTLRDLTVFPSGSSQKALERLEKHPEIEAVIMDVAMPGVNGVAAMKEIKWHHPLVEVILLSAQGTVETAIEGMQKGAFDYLIKPCAIDQLIEKVLDAVKRKRDHEEKIARARRKELGF